MIFLILLVVLSFMLHKICEEKGISPWGYLTAFITGFIVINIATAGIFIYIYGVNVVNDPDIQKKLLFFRPAMMLLHFSLYYFLQRKIARMPDVYHEDEDDNTHIEEPPSKREKKDLSYFR